MWCICVLVRSFVYFLLHFEYCGLLVTLRWILLISMYLIMILLKRLQISLLIFKWFHNSMLKNISFSYYFIICLITLFLDGRHFWQFLLFFSNTRKKTKSLTTKVFDTARTCTQKTFHENHQHPQVVFMVMFNGVDNSRIHSPIQSHP